MTTDAKTIRRGVDVGRASSLGEGAVVGVTARGVELALIRWQGEIFAVRDRCPHHQSSFCHGVVRPVLDADRMGNASLELGRGVVICPWHRWEYELSTGRGLRKPRFRLRKYKVEVVDDRILVDVGRGRSSDRDDAS